MEKEFMSGKILKNTKDNGLAIKWMDLVFSYGQMVKNMKDNF